MNERLVANREGSPHPRFEMEKLREKDGRLNRDNIPTVFVCGAAKAATTSLWTYMVQHPSVHRSALKEPGYFTALRPMQSPKKYEDLFRHAGRKQVAADASTAYLTSPDSAERISSVCPEAKIIIVLRNPADRAFSLYRHMVWHGFEYASTLREGLRLEEERIEDEEFLYKNPEYYYNFLYYQSGRYSEQVDRYLRYFRKRQILFLRFRDFVSETGRVMKEVFQFLEIDSSFQPNQEIYNSGRGRDVWSPRFHYFINQKMRHPLTDWGVVGKALFSGLVRLNGTRGKDELEGTLRNDLLTKYEEDVRLTESMTDLSLVYPWLRVNH